MEKFTSIFKRIWFFVAILLLGYGTWLFFDYNEPIIKQDLLMGLISGIILISLFVMSMKNNFEKNRWFNQFLSLIITIYIVVLMLNSVLFDFFQPLALYDEVIYLVVTGLVMLLGYILVQAIYSIFKGNMNKNNIVVILLLFAFVFQFQLMAIIQDDFEYQHIANEPIHIFESGEGGYDIFRIPTLLVMNKGSRLSNGELLESDRIVVMAEARRNGSLDHGDIDLVQKISHDGGKTLSDLMVIRRYEKGIGKIGNSTPIFDKTDGTIHLLHLAGSEPKNYKTYNMMSYDGGETYTEATFVSEGIVGPGHGIIIEGTSYDGRLIAPGYYDGGSRSVYSDDRGKTWTVSESLPDGNEAEIAQKDEQLIMIVRTDVGVASKHDPLNKLYALSEDGGTTWSDLMIMEEIKEPICMSSIVEDNGRLYYSHPDDYYSRGQMTIAYSEYISMNKSEKMLIYQGPSGYSDLGVAEDHNLYLIFENGAIEYDERITFLKILVDGGE